MSGYAHRRSTDYTPGFEDSRAAPSPTWDASSLSMSDMAVGMPRLDGQSSVAEDSMHWIDGLDLEHMQGPFEDGGSHQATARLTDPPMDYTVVRVDRSESGGRVPIGDAVARFDIDSVWPVVPPGQELTGALLHLPGDVEGELSVQGRTIEVSFANLLQPSMVKTATIQLVFDSGYTTYVHLEPGAVAMDQTELDKAELGDEIGSLYEEIELNERLIDGAEHRRSHPEEDPNYANRTDELAYAESQISMVEGVDEQIAARREEAKNVLAEADMVTKAHIFLMVEGLGDAAPMAAKFMDVYGSLLNFRRSIENAEKNVSAMTNHARNQREMQEEKKAELERSNQHCAEQIEKFSDHPGVQEVYAEKIARNQEAIAQLEEAIAVPLEESIGVKQALAELQTLKDTIEQLEARQRELEALLMDAVHNTVDSDSLTRGVEGGALMPGPNLSALMMRKTGGKEFWENYRAEMLEEQERKRESIYASGTAAIEQHQASISALRQEIQDLMEKLDTLEPVRELIELQSDSSDEPYAWALQP